MAPVSDASPQFPRALPTLLDFRPETLRGTPGFFRVGQTSAGQWWLIDAADRPFFSCAVNAVRFGPRAPSDATEGQFLTEETEANEAMAETLGRLRQWSVNTLGPWSEPGLIGHGLMNLEIMDFARIAPATTIRHGGSFLPDVFDPKWVDACHRQAEIVCAQRRDSAALIGYFTDDGLNWAQFLDDDVNREQRPTLLQICLSLEPGFPAYHAAWEFTLAAHGGELAQLARAWAADLPNKEALRQLTLADTALTSAGYRRDHDRFTREFARRYFSVCAGAIRHHDPHHLILGGRLPTSAPALLAECVPPQMDVLSVSLRGVEDFDRVAALAEANNLPVIIGDFCWAEDTFTKFPAANEPPEWTSVERMLGRGRKTLERALAHPLLVGCAWARWLDAREDRAPFGRGLVHVDGAEAREHSELLSGLYARAETLRCAQIPLRSP